MSHDDTVYIISRPGPRYACIAWPVDTAIPRPAHRLLGTDACAAACAIVDAGAGKMLPSGVLTRLVCPGSTQDPENSGPEREPGFSIGGQMRRLAGEICLEASRGVAGPGLQCYCSSMMRIKYVPRRNREARRRLDWIAHPGKL